MKLSDKDEKFYDNLGNLTHETVHDADGTGYSQRYYYDTGELALLSYNNISDFTRHGRSISYYRSGIIRSTSTFIDGQFHGKYDSYNEDGSISISQSWAHGTTHGPLIRYNENGSVESKIYFLYGEICSYGEFREHELIEELANI